MKMCDKITCQIVRDLLPNYIEGLTGEETNAAIAHHLANCESCRQLHEKLKADMAVPKFEKRDLMRLLKAIRKARLTQIILAVLAGVVFTWAVIFVMASPFSVIAPDEIQFENMYALSDGTMVIAYKVPGLDNSLLMGTSGMSHGNGDYTFEIRTSFWNRLFGHSDPERMMLYEATFLVRSIDDSNAQKVLQERVQEAQIVSYGFGKNSRALWHKGDPVITASPELELYMQKSGKWQGYDLFLADSLSRQSISDPSPTPVPEVTAQPMQSGE